MRSLFFYFRNFFKKSRSSESLEEVLSDFQLKNILDNDNLVNLRPTAKLTTQGIRLVELGVLCIFLFFVFKAYNLQIIKGKEYLEKAERNQFLEVPILPLRGRILDRNGVVLAETHKTETKNSANLGVELYRKYTEKEGLSHVLGYVSYPQKDSSGRYWQSNFVGVSGIEAYYDQLLSGRPGKRIFEKSADNTFQTSFLIEEPVEGKDIQLSLDSELNEFAYQKLKDFVQKHNFQGGSINIIDIETGEVIVLTNYPEYRIDKLANPGTDTDDQKKERKKYLEEINKDKRTPMLNRAIAGTYAPGSTLKPIFALAALHLGLIDPTTSIYSAGYIEVPNVVDPTKKNIFRDWRPHGWVNVRTALANSSDVFFYAIGGGYENQKGLGISRIEEWAKLFGINTLTGIDLGGERVGNIPTPEWKKKVFKENWYLGDTYISSIGQFGFLVTPIALSRMSAALATGGYLINPKLRKDDLPVSKHKISVDVDANWYKVVQEGMRLTITEGTGRKLNSELFTIAGKSGTAEVGVKKDKIHSWITGYFPYENPKYVFTFLCELGIREVSPTPNILAKEVLEKMYLMEEYYQKLQTEI